MNGRRFFNPVARVAFLPARRAGGRAAFVVSAKVSKKSSERNRLKRRLSEMVRLATKNQALPADAVFMVNPGATGMTARSFRENAAKMISQLMIN